MKYELYKQVLEYIPEIINFNNIQINKDHIIAKEIISNAIDNSNDLCIVSLSGGVDSMVLTVILKLLNKKVVCVHINYNNRQESGKEASFIEEWCKYLNIEFVLHEINNIHRGDIKRMDYENQTKNIRFKLYKDVLEKYNGSEILLGHQKDDIIENVFNNICRGRNILDLSVIKNINVIMGVKICRPMVSIDKDKIYEIAHKLNIPYFKDTTPYWSLRGIYRSQVYPLLNKTYSNNLSNNLLNISNQSDQWNELIEEKIITPFMQLITYNNNIVKINIEDYISSPLCFYKNVFTKIFYRFGKSIPTRKSIQILIDTIKNNKSDKILNIKLTKECMCSIHNNILVLTFEV